MYTAGMNKEIHMYATNTAILFIQVLSTSVANVQKYVSGATETVIFCKMFDRFFDCLNTRSLYEGSHKRKDDVKPYRSPTDQRFQVKCFRIHRYITICNVLLRI